MSNLGNGVAPFPPLITLFYRSKALEQFTDAYSKSGLQVTFQTICKRLVVKCADADFSYALKRIDTYANILSEIDHYCYYHYCYICINYFLFHPYNIWMKQKIINIFYLSYGRMSHVDIDKKDY